MPTINANRIAEQRCPICGEMRPPDWFGPELKTTVVDERTLIVRKVVRWRKYLACWRCRESGLDRSPAPSPRRR